MNPELREPAEDMFRVYESLQILNAAFNEITRDYLLPITNQLVTISSVLSIYTLLKYRENVRTEMVVPIIIISLSTATYLFITHLKLGEVHKTSTATIGNWRRKLQLGNVNSSKSRRMALLKYTKGIRPIKAEFTSFGHFTKPKSIVIVGKLTLYTSKLYLMTRRIL
jgi:hypothetical protein